MSQSLEEKHLPNLWVLLSRMLMDSMIPPTLTCLNVCRRFFQAGRLQAATNIKFEKSATGMVQGLSFVEEEVKHCCAALPRRAVPDGGEWLHPALGEIDCSSEICLAEASTGLDRVPCEIG